MPDLTIETGWMCVENERWEAEVTGSKGDIYQITYGFSPHGPCQYDYSCSCPQNRIKHRECKHIRAVKNRRCSWHQQFDAGDVDSSDPKCPRCGADVVAVRWGA